MRFLVWVLGGLIVVTLGLAGLHLWGYINIPGIPRFFSSSEGEWQMEMEYTSDLSGPAGTAHFEGSGSGGISLDKKDPESTISINEIYSGTGVPDVVMSGTATSKITIKGKVADDKFTFNQTWEDMNCQGTISSMGITVNSSECPAGATGWNKELAIEIADGANVVDEGKMDVPGGSVLTYKVTWRLNKGCQDGLPEIKSEVERLLDGSIAAQETPNQTHDKLMDLTTQKFPLNKAYKKNGQCFKVAGASIDLMYKVGDEEDSIFRTIGNVSGNTHHIVSATIDRTTNRDGREIQVFYQATIDIALDPV